MMFVGIVVAVIVQTCLYVSGQLTEQLPSKNIVGASSVSGMSKSKAEPMSVKNANSIIQSPSNAAITSISGSKSLRDYIDLSQDINQKAGIDPNENQLQTIFNLNDITALATAEGEPTVPNMFSHGLNMQNNLEDIKIIANERIGNGTNIQTPASGHIGPHRIPEPAIIPVIIPFDISGNADNKLPKNRETMAANKTNSPADTINGLTLQQNSINLSPNQELHKTLPQDIEPDNAQNQETMLLSNTMESLSPRKSHSEPITTRSFGLSLKNRNIAQLLNGLSNDLTPQRKIVLAQEILNSTKPESEIIAVNSAQQQFSNTATSQVVGWSSPGNDIFQNLPSPLWVTSNQRPMFSGQDFGVDQHQPNTGNGNALMGNKELEQLVNNVVSSVDQNSILQSPDSAISTTAGRHNLRPSDSLNNSSRIQVGLNNIPTSFRNIQTGPISRQNWANQIPWTQRIIANPGRFRVGNLRTNLPSNTRRPTNVVNTRTLTGNLLPRSRIGSPIVNNGVSRESSILTRPVSSQSISRQNPNSALSRTGNSFGNVQLRNTRNIQRQLPGSLRPNAGTLNSRNNVVQRVTVVQRNSNSMRQLPTNQNQNVRPMLNIPTPQTNARAIRIIGGPRPIQNSQQATRNAGNRARPRPIQNSQQAIRNAGNRPGPRPIQNSQQATRNAGNRAGPRPIQNSQQAIRNAGNRPGPRPIQNSQQATRNAGNRAGSSRQIAAVVVSPDALSNMLGQSTSSNENRMLLNLLARQNSTTGPAFRNRNVLSRLLQSIDLPKNMPRGQMLMIYPRRTNSTVSGIGNTGSNRNIIPSLISRLESILSQRRTQSTSQRPSREQLLQLIAMQRQLLQRQQNTNAGGNILPNPTGIQNGLNNQQVNALQQTETNIRGRTSQPASISQTQNRRPATINRGPSSVQRQNIARLPQNIGQQQNGRRTGINLSLQRPTPF